MKKGRGRRGRPTTATRFFSASKQIRYVAIVERGKLRLIATRPGVKGASSSEADRLEELVVNPSLLALAASRGRVALRGVRYLVVRYGRLFQMIIPTPKGHLSIAIEKSGNPVKVYKDLQERGIVAGNGRRRRRRAAPGRMRRGGRGPGMGRRVARGLRE